MPRRKTPPTASNEYVRRFDKAFTIPLSTFAKAQEDRPNTARKVESLRDWISTGTLDDYTTDQFKELIVGAHSANGTIEEMGLIERSRQGGYARGETNKERDKWLRFLAATLQKQNPGVFLWPIANLVRNEIIEINDGAPFPGEDGVNDTDDVLNRCYPNGRTAEPILTDRIYKIISKK